MSSSRPGASGSHGASGAPPGPSDKTPVLNQGGKSFLKSDLREACWQKPGRAGRGEGDVANGPLAVSAE